MKGWNLLTMTMLCTLQVELDQEFFYSGITFWAKCISVGGDYVEK